MENRVIKSRVRLARNLKNFPFPPAMTQGLSRDVLVYILSGIESEAFLSSYQVVQLNGVSMDDRLVLFHKHLISSDFLDNTLERALAFSESEGLSVMFNEEDHFRIQAIREGLALKACFSQVLKFHRFLEQQFELAYHETFGYLTACTTNVGTGMRASVQLHLPGLALSKDADKLIQSFTQLGIELRGTYGEGSDVYGDVYQVSNRRTLGVTEEQIIRELDHVVALLLRAEDAARQKHIIGNLHMTDRMYRALGVVQYAKKLGYKEAYDLMSLIRLGAELDFPDFPSLPKVDAGIESLTIQGNHLQIYPEEQLSIERAAHLKRVLV